MFAITAAALLALFFVAVNTGSLQVTPEQLVSGLFVEYDDTVATIYDLRFPRIFIAMVGGAALAVSGALLQAVIRNPLADPGIIGVSSGASLAAVLVTAFAPALYYFTPLFAFAGGLIAFGLVYSLSWRGGLSPLRVILVGVAVSAMFSGISSAFSSGTGGTLSGVASIVDANITMKTWSDLQTLAGYAVAGLAIALLVTKRCDLLSLEDKTARSLGLDVNKNRLLISAVAVLLASISTAVIGPLAGGHVAQVAGALHHAAWCVLPAACRYHRPHHRGALRDQRRGHHVGGGRSGVHPAASKGAWYLWRIMRTKATSSPCVGCTSRTTMGACLSSTAWM